jgi:TPR repeat protein
VMNRFARDPFPDRPPTVIRMRRYRLTFTDLATHRQNGAYWRKEFAGDFLPAMYLTEQGETLQFNLAAAEAALSTGNSGAAIRIYEQQYRLGNLEAGFGLADVYAQGMGGPVQPEKAFALLSELAERGEVNALHNLGACYEYGVGVPVDDLKAADLYRRAAERGNLLSVYALGTLFAQDRIRPRDDVEGLSLLLRAAARVDADPSFVAFVREDEPAQAKRLMERMPPEDIAQARLRASAWH